MSLGGHLNLPTGIACGIHCNIGQSLWMIPPSTIQNMWPLKRILQPGIISVSQCWAWRNVRLCAPARLRHHPTNLSMQRSLVQQTKSEMLHVVIAWQLWPGRIACSSQVHQCWRQNSLLKWQTYAKHLRVQWKLLLHVGLIVALASWNHLKDKSVSLVRMAQLRHDLTSMCNLWQVWR